MTKPDENEKWKIVEAYSAIFIHSDLHQWDRLKLCFSETITMDYASLNGQPASTVKRDDLISAWSGFLPKFTFTLHYLTNHAVTVVDDRASASCYGHAVHHLEGTAGGDLWEVYGTYNVELVKQNDNWLVTALRYNHKYAAGNLDLPAIASR